MLSRAKKNYDGCSDAYNRHVSTYFRARALFVYLCGESVKMNICSHSVELTACRTEFVSVNLFNNLTETP